MELPAPCHKDPAVAHHALYPRFALDHSLGHTCIILTDHCIDHLSRILTHESTLIPGSTIGKHLRHSLDHYRLLLDAAPSASAAAGVIEVNYDTRVRMVDMETSPSAALGAFEEMDRKLTHVVEHTDLDQDIRLTALTPYHQEFGTTFGREVSDWMA